MSAPEAPKPVEVPPPVESTEAAPVPVVAGDAISTPAVVPTTTEELPKTEGEAVAPVEEKKDAKPEEKVVEPIYSGALGYKAPGLKNAFRFSKKYFWFGEEPVAATNLTQYLRGEKPEIAHPVVAWSSQTGKGLLFFVKHADEKENPAGALNLAYATDLAKDGAVAFAFKIGSHKHAFETQSGLERDGWFVAVEKAIADAKEAKEGIESSDGYKEHKEKISKPTILAAAASSSTPKKSTDVTPKLADAEAPAAAEGSTAAPARAGSSSSGSSNEDKKAKKKSKSRSLSRGKRASIFGTLLSKKDKEPKETEASKAEAEVKKDEPAVAAPVAEPSTTAPVITTDIPKPSEELKTEIDETPIIAPAPVTAAAAPIEEVKEEETTAKAAEDKPKPTKRGSFFGFVDKLKSPREEKKDPEFGAASPAIKEAEVVPEVSKPVEEPPVAALAPVDAPATPVVPETTAEPVAPKVEETKPAATGTPSKEKEHFSFGKFFGSKERAKSPAATEKAAEVKADAPPKLEDTTVASPVAPDVTPVEPTEPVVPAVESKPESKPEEVKKDDTPKKEKRGSIFGTLTRSLSKATGKKDKDAVKKEKLPETAEEAKTDVPVIADPPAETSTAIAPADAPVEKTIGDVPAEAVTVGEPKSAPAVTST